MARKRILVVTAATLFATIVVSVSLAAGESLPRWVISGGGCTGASEGGHTHRGTLGQPVAGAVSGSSETLGSGFWGGGAVGESEPAYEYVYLPLILHGSEGPISIEDAPDTCPGVSIQVDAEYAEDFDHSNDNDWYWFGGSAGQTYTIETLGLESRADTVIYLYASDCSTLIAENDDRVGGDPSSRIAWTPSSSGRYHVMVRSYDYNIYGPDTGYTIKVSAGDIAGADVAGLVSDTKAPAPPTPIPGGER
jgi:hypothetical protein